MNTQRPYENPPHPPEGSLFPGIFQFQVNRLPQGLPYYAATACAPRFFRPPIAGLPGFSYTDTCSSGLTPSPAFSAAPMSRSELNLPAQPSEASLGNSPVAGPITLPPLVPTTPEPGGHKRTWKRVHKQSQGVYRCDKCERTYLSYPALYTHIKLKHPTLNQLLAERKPGRGRPRKLTFEDSKELACHAWLEEEGRRGGPTEVTAGFSEAYFAIYGKPGKYGGLENHPLYLELLKPQVQLPQVKLEQDEAKEPDELGDMRQKRQMNCDQVFAEYLRFVAHRVCKEYYAKVVKFVLMYRECLNLQAKKLAGEKKKLPGMLMLHAKEGNEKGEYCLENNAELIPEVCNDFIMMYFPERCLGLDIEETKGLILHLCNWTFHNRYTCSSLSLMGEKHS